MAFTDRLFICLMGATAPVGPARRARGCNRVHDSSQAALIHEFFMYQAMQAGSPLLHQLSQARRVMQATKHKLSASTQPGWGLMQPTKHTHKDF